MEKDKPHYTGHRARLRARLLEDSTSLADYELLELLLGYVLLRKDTKPLAKALLDQFGDLSGYFSALPAEMVNVEGCGKGVDVQRILIREVLARCVEMSTRKRESLCTPESVAKVAVARLSGCPHEEVWIATLDALNRQISWERITKGAVSGVLCYPRDILELALRRKASGIILVHNHPGGTPQASEQDLEMTRYLERVVQSVGVRFLDHVIVCDNACYSIRKGGLIYPGSTP